MKRNRKLALPNNQSLKSKNAEFSNKRQLFGYKFESTEKKKNLK